MLHSVAEVNRMIAAGQTLLLAGSEEALQQLARGNWIAGTIPYFMSERGGVCAENEIFVNPLPECAKLESIRNYTLETLPQLCRQAPENGFSFLILPAASAVHAAYASEAPDYEGFLTRPVVGWVAGVHLDKLSEQTPKVFNGQTGQASDEDAVALHASLPADKLAMLDTINVFRPGEGDTLTFPETGFLVRNCRVNGQPENFARYLRRTQQNTKLPLTADYNGSIVNVSVQSVDLEGGLVYLFAPVFPEVEYKFAAPVADYQQAFRQALDAAPERADFACNCILNYLYAGLEGKKTGGLAGPVTFGEIAHLLLNQTIVRLFIRDLG